MTVWRMATIAAVVEPVGLNVNWSSKTSDGGGVSSAGKMNCLTTRRSMTRLNTGVMDIGRKSERLAGDDIFGTGLMDAAFQ